MSPASTQELGLFARKLGGLSLRNSDGLWPAPMSGSQKCYIKKICDIAHAKDFMHQHKPDPIILSWLEA